MTQYEIFGGKKGGLKLKQVSLHCLYLDEIIDVRILKEKDEDVPKKALICSNNEFLKVVDMETGAVVQSISGASNHEDIILCVDAYKQTKFLSGSKDNTIRLWDFTYGVLKCLAVFKGHNENVASVYFAPKKMHFFVSASQDNTIKVWDLKNYIDVSGKEEGCDEISSASMTIMAH